MRTVPTLLEKQNCLPTMHRIARYKEFRACKVIFPCIQGINALWRIFLRFFSLNRV
jgi:hypothetical protein